MSPADWQNQQAFDVTLLDARHSALRRLEQQYTARLHGHRLWESSFLLMDYLQQHPPDSGSRVLDAGCGWGLAGIFCAKSFAAQVLAVDIDADVLPFLALHAHYNGVHIDTEVSDFDDLDAVQLSGFDTLIGADICFWDEMAESVFALVERACAADIGRVVITDPGRAPFLAMAEHCVEAFYAELAPQRITYPRPIEGFRLVIENR